MGTLLDEAGDGFRRAINKHVARRANKEDRCTGRFWEGRFKSQALLDEAALYTCMSYVDLNPVRAGMADTLEGSDYTSIQQRLRAQSMSPAARPRSKRGSGRKRASSAHAASKPIALAPLRSQGGRRSRPALEMRLDDYRELLEWTGRATRSKPGQALRGGTWRDKSRAMLPALLTRFSIDPTTWLRTMSTQGFTTGVAFGTEASMNEAASRQGKRWLKGKRSAQCMFQNI